VNAVMNLRVLQNVGKTLTSRKPVCFPRRALSHGVIHDIRQRFIYSPNDTLVSCLKTILKFTLKQLQHVSMLQLHHQKGVH